MAPGLVAPTVCSVLGRTGVGVLVAGVLVGVTVGEALDGIGFAGVVVGGVELVGSAGGLCGPFPWEPEFGAGLPVVVSDGVADVSVGLGSPVEGGGPGGRLCP